MPHSVPPDRQYLTLDELRDVLDGHRVRYAAEIDTALLALEAGNDGHVGNITFRQVGPGLYAGFLK